MLNLSGLLGRGFDNIFDIHVFPVVLTLLLYTDLIPANYSGESKLGSSNQLMQTFILHYSSLSKTSVSGSNFILFGLLIR